MVDCYNTSTQVKLNLVSGFVILNYTSDKHSLGSGVHNHTTFWNLISSSMTGADPYLTDVTSASIAPIIPESSYFGTVGLFETFYGGPFRATMGTQAKIQSGEDKGDGWKFLSVCSLQASGGAAHTWFFTADASKEFTRFPGDQRPNRLGLETARIYRCNIGNEAYISLYMTVTYHAIVYSIQGSVTGYTGDGSGIQIGLFKADTNEFVSVTTTAIGGSFSFNWYDNTQDMFAEGIQDSTHRGRSDNATAV
jgi:hypothetical protein